MTGSRRALLAAIAPLPVIVACGTAPPPPARNSALPPPPPAGMSRFEPAPVPSEAASDFAAARRAGLAPAPTGSNALPTVNAGQRVNTDMTTAPMPADPIRLPQR